MAVVRRSFARVECQVRSSANSLVGLMPPLASATTTAARKRGSDMSWSITAKGAAGTVLQSLEAQIAAIKKNLEDEATKEWPIVKAHLEAMLQFLSGKLSNLGSAAHVEVTADGHKAEGMVHEMDLKIRHVELPKIEAEIPKVEEKVSTEATKVAETVSKVETTAETVVQGNA
jgi:hypothetical protein